MKIVIICGNSWVFADEYILIYDYVYKDLNKYLNLIWINKESKTNLNQLPLQEYWTSIKQLAKL